MTNGLLSMWWQAVLVELSILYLMTNGLLCTKGIVREISMWVMSVMRTSACGDKLRNRSAGATRKEWTWLSKRPSIYSMWSSVATARLIMANKFSARALLRICFFDVNFWIYKWNMTVLSLIHEYLFQSYFSIQRYYLAWNCISVCKSI
jgi:hypothetical protein